MAFHHASLPKATPRRMRLTSAFTTFGEERVRGQDARMRPFPEAAALP